MPRADSYPAGSKLADPAFRHARAVKAATARTNVDHYIRKLVASAPPLTAEQIQRLRDLLPPATVDGGGHG